METASFFTYLAVVAGITYAIRMIPLVLFRGKIKSQFVNSFFFYIPYAVLAAMTIPEVLYSTGNVYTALVGIGGAVFLAWRNKGLLTVAFFASLAALLAGLWQ